MVNRNRLPLSILVLAAAGYLQTVGEAQQTSDLIQINSPAQGSTFAPGQTITVAVNVSEQDAFSGVLVAGDNIGYSSLLTAGPFSFSLYIPAGTIGPATLVAVGLTSPGNAVFSNPVTIDLEPPAPPTSITTDLQTITFDAIGEQYVLSVGGTFADGSSAYVTRSSYMSYSSSNNAVATVDSNGAVTATGAGSATIVAAYAQSGHTYKATIPVTVSTPLMTASPLSIAFPNQGVGTTSAPQAVVVKNTSSAPVNISSVPTSGPFAESDNCVSGSPLPAGASCTIQVTFTPRADGSATGTLTVVNNLTMGPLVIGLTGAGLGPGIALSAQSIVFGGQSLGTTTAPQTVTITNIGSSALSISSVAASTGFNETDNCVPSSPIAAGATCNVKVTFSPTAAGIASGTLKISDNVAGSPQVIALTGVGSTAPPAPAPTFSVSGGTYTSVLTVAMSDAASGATIYYTTDGTTPTALSNVYAGAITVASSLTLRAVPLSLGYSTSAVASVNYTINLAPVLPPTFLPAPGALSGPQPVTISETTPGATIYYTTDGSIPTAASTEYTTAVYVASTEVIKAIAVAPGYSDSAVAAATYVIGGLTAEPGFSPLPGFYGSGPVVQISDVIPGVVIYYTLDQSTPTTSSPKYTAPVPLTQTTIIKAIAVSPGLSASPIRSATYLVNGTSALGWVWSGGSNQAGQSGSYGTLGSFSATAIAPPRESGAGWTDNNGNLWMFGGDNSQGELNDLWEYSPSRRQWAWMGGSASVNQPGSYGTKGTFSKSSIPGARSAANAWADTDGNLWLFGGATDSNLNAINDLWEFNPAADEWAWISGAGTTDQPGTYGTLGQAASANVPGARSAASSWMDQSGNLWLFGGFGYTSVGIDTNGWLNDLWRFNPASKQWAWMGGSNEAMGASGIYGTQGQPSTKNIPGAREQACAISDIHGNFWLFGGQGFDSTGTFGTLNDLWRFNPGTLEWTWMSGSNTGNPVGVYGILGNAGSANVPGARISASCWSDPRGNLWMFGGFGETSASSIVELNDLWLFSPTQGQWVWMGGSNQGWPSGTYGVIGTQAAGDVPGGRSASTFWMDATGEYWLLGGFGSDASGNLGYLNDLWAYQFSATTLPTATPSVIITATPSSITTAQALSVTIAVSGGSGAPTPTGPVIVTSGKYASGAIPLANGSATFSIPAGSLAMGSDTLMAAYSPDSGSSTIYNKATAAVVVLVTSSSKTTPTLTVTPALSSIAAAQPLSVTVAVTGGNGHPIPTGSVTLSGGGYTSASSPLSGGTASITIPAGSLATGSDTLTAVYTPDSASSSTYNNATGSAVVTVTTASASTYSMTATALTLSAGATGESTVTVNSTHAYAGTISFNCSMTSTPSGATDPPTFSCGQAVTLGNSVATGTSVVTAATTAASSANLARPGPARPSGRTAKVILTVLVFLLVPAYTRRWRSIIGIAVVLTALGILDSCGGGGSTPPQNPNPGTTPGSYTITVTGTGNDSAKTTAKATIALTVQ